MAKYLAFLKTSPLGVISTISVDRTWGKKLLPAKDNNPTEIYTRPCQTHGTTHLLPCDRLVRGSGKDDWVKDSVVFVCPFCWSVQDTGFSPTTSSGIEVYYSNSSRSIIRLGYAGEIYKNVHPTKFSSKTASRQTYVSPCVKHLPIRFVVDCKIYGAEVSTKERWVSLLDVGCCPFCWTITARKGQLIFLQGQMKKSTGESNP